MSVLLLGVLGFGLRYLFLHQMQLHMDEFTSLLAIKMVLEKGVPIHPTGIFDGKGIVFSYLGAAVSTLFSFSVVNVRYLSLTAAILTIVLVYWLANRLFDHKAAAFLSALLFAVHPMAVEWGGRARMYSVAAFFVFLVILVGWQSLVWRRQRPHYASLTPLAVLAALLSHLAIAINLPALILALTATYWLLYKPKIGQPKTWRWLVVVIVSVIIVTALSAWISKEPGEIRQWQEDASLLSNMDSILLELGLLSKAGNFFLTPENLGATFFCLVGILALIIKAGRRSLTRIDIAAVFIYTQLIITFFLLYTIVPGSVRDERHNFMVLLPFLILGMAYGLAAAERWIKASQIQRSATPLFYGIASLFLLMSQWPGLNFLMLTDEANTYRYDTAVTRLKTQMQPGDQELTVAAPASYLFGGTPAAFYANQHKPRFIREANTGRLIDYYTGSQYLLSVEDFDAAVDQPGKLWFAVDDTRLVRNYEPRFSQEIMHQMHPVDRVGNITIFKESDGSWPMAATPDVELAADFSNQLHLIGYAARLVNTNLRLTFFWKPVDPIFHYKVFVHLRDQNGNTVAQADFTPYKNMVHMSQWLKTWGDEVPVATGTTLRLPPDIAGTDASQYRLYVGLYAPEFNRRVPLINDTSGENAVILTDLGLTSALTDSRTE